MLQNDKHLHFYPTFESPIAYGDRYCDISNSDLCIWSLTDFSLLNCFPKVSEAYYIKLRFLTDDYLVISETYVIKLFSLTEGKVVQVIEVTEFIQYAETNGQGTLATVFNGKDQYSKCVSKYQLVDNKLVSVGQVDVKYEKSVVDAIFMLNVFASGKVFLYVKHSERVFEVSVQEKQFKGNTVPNSTTLILEMSNKQNFAVATTGKININDPVKGSVYGCIECPGEIYSALLQLEGKDSLITASNKGVKLWFLESKTVPKVFAKSDKFQVDKLHIDKGRLIGVSSKNKMIAVWDLESQQLIRLQKIARQEIQKSFKLGEGFACLVIKVYDQTEESLSFHHRLELLDVSNDTIKAFKEVKNANFQIQVNTIVEVDRETIKFICSSEKDNKQKSYLFTWRPFVMQQKKEITKIEMTKAPITKLYSYDRLLLATPPRQKTAVFNLFKKGQHTTTITVYTHGLKKLGETVLEGHFDNIQIDQNGQLYAMKDQKISILELTQQGTIIQKNLVQLQLSKIYFINQHLLGVNREGDRALYDRNLELIMKHSCQNEETIQSLTPIDKDQFLIVTSEQVVEKWNIKDEKITSIKLEFEIMGVSVEGQTLLVTRADRIQKMDLGRL